MRKFLVLGSALLLSACATGVPERPDELPTPVAPSPHVDAGLIGLTAGELVQRFGAPALQVREGAGLKLQFRGRGCVLDAYLYRPTTGQGVERVTHVDTRLASGADTVPAVCIAALQGA